MTDVAVGVDEDAMTIDDLSVRSGVSVRTTRYYATLGLLPPPDRRGRMAYYGAHHLARLELIRVLQSHGLTLAEIETYLARIPESATPEHLELRRSVLASWSPGAVRWCDRGQLEGIAGRALTDADLALAARCGVLARDGELFWPRPGFEIVVELVDIGVAEEGIVEASDAIGDRLGALAGDLGAIMRRHLLEPHRREGGPTVPEATVERLRSLTVQAVLSGFQRASDDMITRDLGSS